MYPNKVYPYSGIFIHEHVRYLQKAGCLIRVISPVPYAPKVLWYNPKWKFYSQIPAFDVIDGIEIDYFRYINFPGSWCQSIACYAIYYGIKNKLHSVIDKFQPEILHVHAVTPDGYLGLILKEKYDLPLVCSMRGSDINLYPYRDRLTMLLTKKVISEADQIVSVSLALKAVAESIGKPKKEIQVVYNGCDLSTFHFSNKNRFRIRNKMGISKKEKIIIFIGAIDKQKGIFELITAFIKLNSKYSDLHLILIGDGHEYSTIENMISSNNLNNKIHLIGSKPQNEIHNFLSAADIFVLPTYVEGFPNVVFEAMACGLPVIATRVGGIPEIVTEDTGILIPPKNTEILTKEIKRMLSKIFDRNVIRGHIESFTWEKNAQQTIHIYQDVLSKYRN